MDKTDYKIISFLQENARISNSEIARQIGMVPSGVLERIRKLEDNGHIQEYTVRIKPESLDLKLLAFIFICTTETAGCCETAAELAKLPEILEVHNVAGEDCYMVKIRVSDTKALADFMREKIGVISSITSTRTVIALETVKETSKLYPEKMKKENENSI